MKKYDDLKEILADILSGEIEAGINKQYCFVWDEDGILSFLKRPEAAVIGEINEEFDDEPRTQWPVNSYDGEELWSISPGDQRGGAGIHAFLEALNIKYLG